MLPRLIPKRYIGDSPTLTEPWGGGEGTHSDLDAADDEGGDYDGADMTKAPRLR